jgi:2'-5' RNA ligase
MKSHYPYDVILLTPIEVEKESIKLSEYIARRYPVEFILDGKTRYPHVTLFQVEMPNSKLKEVKKKLKKILQGEKTLDLIFSSFSTQSRFISWNCRLSGRLKKLHERIVREIEPFREGLKVSVVLKAHVSFTEKQTSQLEKYGAIGLLEEFKPHITISRLKNDKDANILIKEFSKLKNIHTMIDKIAIGKLSDHGTVVDIIESYPLQ